MTFSSSKPALFNNSGHASAVTRNDPVARQWMDGALTEGATPVVAKRSRSLKFDRRGRRWADKGNRRLTAQLDGCAVARHVEIVDETGKIGGEIVLGRAADALSYDDTTVSAMARHLGVAWHTAWTAIEAEAKARVAVPERLAGVKTLGVDEHIWRPSRVGTDRA
jgi:hypothetical protein